MPSANTITEVYQDEDGWFRFELITPDGYRIRSGEFAHESNATLDRNYFAARLNEQVKFMANFGFSGVQALI